MTDKQLSAFIAVIAPRLLALLVERNGFTEQEAVQAFYASELYAALEREETKLWHFSAQTLYALLDEELRMGKITYPEEL